MGLFPRDWKRRLTDMGGVGETRSAQRNPLTTNLKINRYHIVVNSWEQDFVVD